MKKKRTILFYTYYGNHYGTGHLYRDVQLGNVFSGFFKIFYSIRGSQPVSKIFPHGSAIVSSNFREALQKTKPDLVIYDQPYDLGSLPKFFYSKPLTILGLDYFFYRDIRFRAIINLVNKYQKGKITIPHVYEGLDYAIIRPAIRKLSTTPVKKSVQSLLVAFGGADISNHTGRVLEALSLLKGNFHITVVLGPLFSKKRDIESLSRASPHTVTIKYGPIELAPFLGSADVAIGGSGATLMEALSLGKPCVTVPQSTQEYDFLRDSKLNHCALVLGRTWTKKRIAGALQNFFTDYAKRKQYASMGKKRIDGKGIERIQKIISHLI